MRVGEARGVWAFGIVSTKPDSDNQNSTMATRVIHVDSDSSAAQAAEQGARALESGSLVAFPTETVYGVAAMASLPEALQRLRELKSRPRHPFTVHIGRPEEASRYIAEIPSAARRLMARSWPGPVTLLLKTGGSLADPKLHDAGLHDVLTQEGVIGLRCPDESVAAAMLTKTRGPVVAPSANRAGKPAPRSAEEVLAGLDGEIDLLIDTGPSRLGSNSTIVSFDEGGWRLVRAGPHDERALRRLMRLHLLFVCTGNTCRSPMAAGLAKKLLAEREGCRVGELRPRGVQVHSAGLYAGEGAKATAHAVFAAKELGADISHHRSRKLTAELINAADAVFCMTDRHVADARRLLPEAAEKIRRLDAHADIPDPIGGGGGVYRRAARLIEDALGKRLDEEA
jgi:tRNA threonylcarbamoyl adenosine modification protein (Sua5/YciO/YrdC/YwlC family)